MEKARVREALGEFVRLWDELFPAEKERIVKLLSQEVLVSKDAQPNLAVTWDLDAILRGQEPARVSLATLRHGVSLLWTVQDNMV